MTRLWRPGHEDGVNRPSGEAIVIIDVATGTVDAQCRSGREIVTTASQDAPPLSERDLRRGRGHGRHRQRDPRPPRAGPADVTVAAGDAGRLIPFAARLADEVT